jgi:flagellar protein FlbD
VIRLRRLGHKSETFFLNPDLIVSIEATPDTVVSLTTHTKVIVSDSPEDVVAAVLGWRAGILTAALPVTRRRSEVPLALVRGTTGDPQAPVERDDRR